MNFFSKILPKLNTFVSKKIFLSIIKPRLIPTKIPKMQTRLSNGKKGVRWKDVKSLKYVVWWNEMCSGRCQCCGSNEMVCKRVEVFCPWLCLCMSAACLCGVVLSLSVCVWCAIVVVAFAVHIRVYHRHHDCCLQSGIWIVAVVCAVARARALTSPHHIESGDLKCWIAPWIRRYRTLKSGAVTSAHCTFAHTIRVSLIRSHRAHSFRSLADCVSFSKLKCNCYSCGFGCECGFFHSSSLRWCLDDDDRASWWQVWIDATVVPFSIVPSIRRDEVIHKPHTDSDEQYKMPPQNRALAKKRRKKTTGKRRVTMFTFIVTFYPLIPAPCGCVCVYFTRHRFLYHLNFN